MADSTDNRSGSAMGYASGAEDSPPESACAEIAAADRAIYSLVPIIAADQYHS